MTESVGGERTVLRFHNTKLEHDQRAARQVLQSGLYVDMLLLAKTV